MACVSIIYVCNGSLIWERRAEELSQGPQLVLGQGFGGEHIDGCCIPVGCQGLDEWQVVAERLSTGSRGGNHKMLPCRRDGQFTLRVGNGVNRLSLPRTVFRLNSAVCW